MTGWRNNNAGLGNITTNWRASLDYLDGHMGDFNIKSTNGSVLDSKPDRCG